MASNAFQLSHAGAANDLDASIQDGGNGHRL